MAARFPLLITFSGIDGAGKSTQIGRLRTFLGNCGQRPVCIWSRGGYTPALERLKAFLRRVARGRLPPPGQKLQREAYMQRRIVRKLWLTMAILDLIRLYAIEVRLWRLLGRSVICDRYLWDTLIDFRLNFPQEDVVNWWLWRLLKWLTPKPDAAFLLMLPLTESVRRCQMKDDPYLAPYDLQVRRSEMYRELKADQHLLLIDALQSAEEVSAQVWKALNIEHNRRGG